jgi:hypothetical protein
MKPKAMSVRELDAYLTTLPPEWSGHIIDVADTMEICKRWFQTHSVTFSDADLIAMARMTLDRENLAHEREAAADREAA